MAEPERKLRTLGMLGGLSWHSTLSYYRIINSIVESRLGEFHSAPILLSSVDFAPIVKWQLAGEWDVAGHSLGARAAELESIGAQALVISSNTMHKVVPQIKERVEIPILHMATAVATELKNRGHRKVVLLGTRYTMRERFLYEALEAEGVTAEPPPPAQARAVNEAIFKRLVFGRVTEEDQGLLNDIVKVAQNSGYSSVILGCTELGLLANSATPEGVLVDSTEAHAKMAAEFVLQS